VEKERREMGWRVQVIKLDLDLRLVDRETRSIERERAWSHLNDAMDHHWEPFAVVPTASNVYQVFVKRWED
jgi:hypothetical protein